LPPPGTGPTTTKAVKISGTKGEEKKKNGGKGREKGGKDGKKGGGRWAPLPFNVSRSAYPRTPREGRVVLQERMEGELNMNYLKPRSIP